MTVFARVFPLRIGYAIGEVVAFICYWIWERKRAAAKRNYATVLGVEAGSADATKLARQAFRNFGRSVVELFRFQPVSPAELRSLLTFRGFHHVEEALKHGKGVIFVGAHIGSMEAASSAFSLAGHRVIAAAEWIRPDCLMRYMERARAKWGITLVPVERAGLRLLQALRRNKMVVLVADVGIKYSGGVRVRFFGRETLFPAGPARLSRLSGAPVIFAYAVRGSGEGYDIIFGEPVLPVRTGDETADLGVTTQEVADQMEQAIRRYPDQWYMFRDMWPRQPLAPLAETAFALSTGTGTAAS